ncbi:MAG: amidohydrolase family protein [Myxococcota bacterium]
MPGRLFTHVRLGDERHDVYLAGGRIARIEPPGTLSGAPGVTPSEPVVTGGWLTPPLAEPHVHLDAALLGARRPNRSGTLREGIANWAVLREELSADDVVRRARQTIAMYRSWGATRIRSHVDTGSLLAVEALVGLKHALVAEGVTLQLVAFPQEGILRAPGRRVAWEEAVALGCDVVGAIPHFERTADEGWRSVRLAFDLAEKHGAQLDFHCDETDDPGSRNLEVVCAEAIDRGFAGRVVASHCTALHSYPNPHAAKVIELVATAGVQVVCNPLDNVVLQGRYDGYPRRRGLTRVDQLWAAGASVAIGHDSVQDPWYRLGTANLMDAAYMLIHVGQLTGEDEMRRVVGALFGENHRPFGGPPALGIGAGPVLWWPHDDAIDLVRERPRPTLIVD